MTTRERAARLSLLLAGLPAGEIRRGGAARALAALPDDEAAALVEELTRMSGTRDERALAATEAVLAATLHDPALRARLHAASSPEGKRLLEAGAPLRSFAPDDAPEDPELTQLSLGHRKALARGRDPDLLARLSKLGEPAVVRALLQNPRLTEPQVVRLSSTRPLPAATLREVAASRRFGRRPAIMRALVKNPYTEVELALALLPLLPAPDLRDLASDPTAHETLRSEARSLLLARGGRERERALLAPDPVEEQRRLHALRAEKEAARRVAIEEEERRLAEEAQGELQALIALVEGGTRLRPVDDDA